MTKSMVTLAVMAEHDTFMPKTEGPMSTEPCSHVTVTQLTVRPADMDADRNVNNADYLAYFHQSRLEHLARRGV